MVSKSDQAGAFRKYVVEFVGTFFLVMCICMTMGGSIGHLAPLAIGLTLVMLVYAGGYLSGAHFNPAVSVAVYLRGKLTAGDLCHTSWVNALALCWPPCWLDSCYPPIMPNL